MTPRPLIHLGCLAALLAVAPAQARNILLCNDDGIVAANLRALKQRPWACGW
ncbi:MAG TPA: hypothetical protein VET87_01175 [Rubrivivax sp.]|nr:hypothetical protein [Rubrivivax sp.]